MAKFYGPIGFAVSTETEEGSGIYEDVVVERYYRGDVIKAYHKWDHGEHLNSNLTISNTISIVTDPFASENVYRIKYIKWLGGYWEITGIDIQPPRLVLSIGGVYNGPTAGFAEAVDDHPRFR